MRKLFMKSVLLSFLGISVIGQSKTKSFNFKKGEVFDLLLVATFHDAGTLFEKYKKTAFPVASAYTYQPQPGFATKKLILGNHLPASLVIGKWKNKKNREGFLDNIVSKVPDFHEQRKALFSYFKLTYYEIPKDISFSVNADNYNVATALWGKDEKSLTKFYSQWVNKIKKHGGKLMIKLTDGKSPTGYYHNADVFCIIEWSSKEAFDTFTKKHPLSSYEVLKDVHQFVIK